MDTFDYNDSTYRLISLGAIGEVESEQISVWLVLQK